MLMMMLIRWSDDTSLGWLEEAGYYLAREDFECLEMGKGYSW